MNPWWLLLIVPASMIAGIILSMLFLLVAFMQLDEIFNRPPDLRTCEKCKVWLKFCTCGYKETQPKQR